MEKWFPLVGASAPDKQQMVGKSPYDREPTRPPVTLHTHVLRVVNDMNSQLSKASSGTQAAMQTLTIPLLTADGSTSHLAYAIKTLNTDKLSHKLLVLKQCGPKKDLQI